MAFLVSSSQHIPVRIFWDYLVSSCLLNAPALFNKCISDVGRDLVIMSLAEFCF